MIFAFASGWSYFIRIMVDRTERPFWTLMAGVTVALIASTLLAALLAAAQIIRSKGKVTGLGLSAAAIFIAMGLFFFGFIVPQLVI